jgi:hypothetical protein
LHVIAFGAGLAGDKVTTSSKTVVASQSTTFQLKSYTSSPPASAFRLPSRAKITKQ